MYYDYFHVAFLLAFGVIMVYGAIIFGGLLRPSKPSELKLSTY